GFLQIAGLHIVGDPEMPVSRVGIGCGSAGEFIHSASRAGCQVLLTGEARFHTCLEAEAIGMAMILPGHYASERFALETLATQLTAEFSDVSVWASRQESDPLTWME
ncbi:MAG: Nif3-like dinuclear metal center hexameric protein, partial [Planctomycetaceae bacterium]|nr:Nif3-like dinuclear metal center hexameric protein [Planctomycetaceae bacterium]